MAIERVETAHGPMWIPDTDTHQYGWLKRGGISCEEFYIREVLDLLREKPPGVAFDVGACFGCWSLPLGRVCNKVLAIEPQRRLYELLVKTFYAAQEDAGFFGIFEPTNVAAGDDVYTRTIAMLDLQKPANFGDTAVSQAHEGSIMTPVRCMPLDEFRHDDEDGPVTFIKIDVQGMERVVLRGAEATIRRCKPWLFVEAHPSYGNPRAIREQIEAMGYVCLARGDNFLAGPI